MNHVSRHLADLIARGGSYRTKGISGGARYPRAPFTATPIQNSPLQDSGFFGV